MTFREKEQQIIDDIHKTQTVSKIKQYMDRVRNDGSIELARRWVIELLQNARDVAYDDQKVKVKIDYDDEKNLVSFSHNGRSFRTKDVLNIIHQVTSKMDDVNSIGQFGTGFMTTYFLSEQVQIDGVAKDEETPYKKFSFHIDRRGDDKESISDSIEASIQDFLLIDKNAVIADENYHKGDFNTKFTYRLTTDDAKKNALIGIDDLIYNVKYILLFSEKIESIEINKKINGKISKRIFKRKDNILISDNLGIGALTISDNEDNYTILYKNGENATVAFEVDDLESKNIVRLNDNTARLYIDFPLLGSESYGLPCVVNSLSFNPNESRSSISTIENANSRHSIENRKILLEAVESYKCLFTYILEHNFNDFENAMYINEFKENAMASTEWHIKNIYEPLYNYFLNANIIDTHEKQMVSLSSKNCVLLKGGKNEIKVMRKLIKLSNAYHCSMSKDNLYDIFMSYIKSIGDIDEQTFVITIEEMITETNNIISKNIKPGNDVINYLNIIYKLLDVNKDLKDYIILNNIPIFISEREYNKTLSGETQILLCGINDIYINAIKEPILHEIATQLSNNYQFCNARYQWCNAYFNTNDIRFRNLLAKNLVINPNLFSDDKVVNDICAKEYINAKIASYTNNNINNQDERVQDLALKLASYITSANTSEVKGVNNVGFTNYETEEEVNTLRSNAAIAKITFEHSKYQELFNKYKIENSDELEQLLKTKNANSISDDLYDIIGDEFEFVNEEDAFAFAKKIGEVGERLAFTEVCKYIENSIKTLPENESKNIEVIDKNTKSNKQQGYDFEIISYDKILDSEIGFDKNNYKDTRISRTYIEVKSHTMNARHKNILKLSKSQYKKAILDKESFIVILASINTNNSKDENNWALDGDLKAYKNLAREISDGKIEPFEPIFVLSA